MLNTSQAYREAIVGLNRWILPKAVMEVVDPDIAYGAVSGSAQSPYSKPEELHDQVYDAGQAYATLESGIWGLDGSVALYDGIPEDNQGWMGEELCGEDGTFDTPQVVTLNFTGVSILQAASVWFARFAPADFTFEILSEGTVVRTWEVTDNADLSFAVKDFTGYNPTAIRVTVTRMTRGYVRLRVAEIVPGVYEQWQGDELIDLAISHQADPSCLSLPYGSATVTIDNRDRRFEPRRRDGLFQMLEARQALRTRIGVKLASGTVEYVPTGVFYLRDDSGYKTGDNSDSITWRMVDIVGLLSNRTYIVPDVLPTTAAGWLASIVGQLGDNYAGLYQIDETLGATALTCTAADVANVKCGDLARWVCMAIKCFPRANAETGALEAAQVAQEATGRLTLDDMTEYPSMTTNSDVAALIFDLAGTLYTVTGTQGSSGLTVNIKNPFITTQAQALDISRHILAFYGGNKFELRGYGDPSCEMGDIDLVDLDERAAANGRRTAQELTIKDGVMGGVPSTLITANGVFAYTQFREFTEDEEWTVPDGVTEFYVILVGGGDGGQAGTAGKDGTAGWSGGEGNDNGTPGEGGAGGMVLAQTIQLTPGQTLAVHIGSGGAAGQAGGNTTLGGWSSAGGVRQDNGVADILAGGVYGQKGSVGQVSHTPVRGAAGPANSGFGGNGGSGGRGGVWAMVTVTITDGNTGTTTSGGMTVPVLKEHATAGGAGGAGGSGVARIYWEE